MEDANEQLSKETKKTKLCKETIMKSQSIIQISIDRKRVLGISLNELAKKKGELLSKKKRLKRYIMLMVKVVLTMEICNLL